MTSKRLRRVALVGNPNSGKSSLFNELTGLNQKISNYPGVTVERKTGLVDLPSGDQMLLVDFPGTYSMYPNSSEERLVVNTFTDPSHENYPDAIIYVAGAIELEKHFLLATQLRELGIPMLFCLAMSDIGERKGIQYDLNRVSDYLGVPCLKISTMTGENIDVLRTQLLQLIQADPLSDWKQSASKSDMESEAIRIVSKHLDSDNSYRSLLIAHHHSWLIHLSAAQRIAISSSLASMEFASTKLQIDETLRRFNRFTPVIQKAEQRDRPFSQSWTNRVDSIITHRVLGPLIFFAAMFFIFQAIYSWSELPTVWIENGFAALSNGIRDVMPQVWYTDLIADGIIPGLGGILVFIPQITILFLLIGLLEEVGYMSRAVFMFDGLMQKVGLNGRSIVALVSSGACAIPAIMSTRTIANWKERLITIMVAPLISCSARIPIYTVLIGFVVADHTVLGIFDSRGLAFMCLYLLGITVALVSAWVFKQFIRSGDHSFLMIELPQYKRPILQNVMLSLKEKVWSFVWDAGKIIFVISIILWFLGSYGPGTSMDKATDRAIEVSQQLEYTPDQQEGYVAAQRMEASYAGVLGKWIEPAISPLGYDWKMGIALITSFAAREVFVGTMATIYSVGGADDNTTLRERMAQEINPKTGGPRYDLATSASLLLFYVFAMQCMSTLAVTRRETNSWKWPIIQFLFMGALAYLSSFSAYQILS
ncbi:MAG: ferrous iron transport protein B [Bacteroidota bacterium]